MNTLENVTKKLNEIIKQENQTPPHTLGGFIVGLLIATDNKDIENLVDTNKIISRIADLASNLEIKNGNEADMWKEIKTLTADLSSGINS